jgi:hypothetical protein
MLLVTSSSVLGIAPVGEDDANARLPLAACVNEMNALTLDFLEVIPTLCTRSADRLCWQSSRAADWRLSADVLFARIERYACARMSHTVLVRGWLRGESYIGMLSGCETEPCAVGQRRCFALR